MATIRKRGQRYEVQVRKQGAKPINKSFGTKRDAEAWARAVEAGIDRGDLIATSTATFSDAIERFRRDVRFDKYHDATLDWWRDALGARQLRTLTKADFYAARDVLKVRVTSKKRLATPATTNRKMAMAQAVLRHGMKVWPDAFPRGNVAHIGILSGEVERDRFLSDAELTRLLAACERASDARLLPLVLAALSSGCRAGELAALRWQDIDTERGLVTIHRSKNGEKRAAPLKGRALAEVRRMKDFVDYPMCDVRRISPVSNEGPFNRFRYRTTWNRALRVAGIEDFRFHDLRHTAASYLVMSGVDVYTVGKVLGHKSAVSTRRYAHLSVDHISDVGDVMIASKSALA